MGRKVQVTHGEYLGLNESDPELAMRDAQREYYEMQTPQSHEIDTLLRRSRGAIDYDNDQEIDISFTTEK